MLQQVIFGEKGNESLGMEPVVPGELQNEGKTALLRDDGPSSGRLVRLQGDPAHNAIHSCNNVTELEPRSPSLRSELIPKNIGRD
jgi:hypothetical protein